MMTVTLRRSGAVGVKVTTRNERKFLHKIKYIKSTGDVGATWWTYLTDIRRDFPASRLKWDRSVKQNLKAIVGALRRSKQGDDAKVNSVFREGKKPYSFQMKGIHFALNTKRCLIADDTGLGKTIQTIGAMLVVLKENPAKKAILVVPSGLRHQWHEQIHEFGSDKDTPDNIIVIDAPKATRRVIYKKNWKVMIISPNVLVRDYDLVRKQLKDVILVGLDEASCVRNPEAKITKVMGGMFKKIEYKIALTATPIENKLVDLWSILQFVDKRIFISNEFFEERYVQWSIMRFKVKNKAGREFKVKKRVPSKYINLSEVRQKISPAYIRRRVSDVELELPKLIINWEKVTLPQKQRDVYNACKEEVQLEGMRDEALYSKLQGLRQACNSTELIIKNDPRPSSSKIDRIKTLLETELYGEQVIIFSDYARFCEILAKKLRNFKVALFTGNEKKATRRAAMQSFKDGTRRILICTSAGERGHNLQNANVIINADLPWNPARIKQRLGRIVRLGSNHKTCRMINFIALGTIEQSLILEKIYNRRALFEAVFKGDELTTADPLKGKAGKELRSLM